MFERLDISKADADRLLRAHEFSFEELAMEIGIPGWIVINTGSLRKLIMAILVSQNLVDYQRLKEIDVAEIVGFVEEVLDQVPNSDGSNQKIYRLLSGTLRALFLHVDAETESNNPGFQSKIKADGAIPITNPAINIAVATDAVDTFLVDPLPGIDKAEEHPGFPHNRYQWMQGVFTAVFSDLWLTIYHEDNGDRFHSGKPENGSNYQKILEEHGSDSKEMTYYKDCYINILYFQLLRGGGVMTLTHTVGVGFSSLVPPGEDDDFLGEWNNLAYELNLTLNISAEEFLSIRPKLVLHPDKGGGGLFQQILSHSKVWRDDPSSILDDNARKMLSRMLDRHNIPEKERDVVTRLWIAFQIMGMPWYCIEYGVEDFSSRHNLKV